MKIVSPAFVASKSIPAKYTCDGKGVNPPLQISDVPTSAKTLALIIEDPDAPVGNWIHWLVWNINSKTIEIREGEVPPGSVQGLTSFNENVYGGPCPPDREHRYYFRLFALDTELRLSPVSDSAKLRVAMEGHILDSAELMGLYKR